MNIPGVTGTYDKYVEALMKVERIPRDNAQKDLDGFKAKREAWQTIVRLSTALRTISKKLYSFENPFAEKVVGSTNEKAVTAVAQRGAENASFKIRVDRVARPDSFLSAPVDKKTDVPAGTYTFVVGDKTISFNWKGGNYRAFMDAVNKRGKGILSVSEIRTTANSTSLLFKSEVLGEANRLTFEDDALSFALKNGIIKKNDASSVSLDKQSLTLQPHSSDKISFSKIVRATEGGVLEVTVSKYNGIAPDGVNGSAQAGAPSSDGDAAFKTYEVLGSISYKGVTVTNEASAAGNITGTNAGAGNPAQGGAGGPFIPYANEAPNFSIISLESSRGVLIPAPPLSNAEGEQKVVIDLAGYGDVKGISFNNPNANTSFVVSNVRVYDPKSTGEYTAANPVSVAQDALINFEGIQIQRPTNDIDDLIPSVTLHLHDQTDGIETVDVKPDAELVKNAVIEFVANYNNLITELNILTQNRPEVVDELTYLSDEEREAAQKRLGLFSGDGTLSSLKNTLRMKTTSAYKAKDESKIILLKNMGVSTNSTVGGEIEAGRLRGYLEIDEKALDEAISGDLNGMKEFFGFDKNGDMLIDYGLAFSLYEQLSPYLQRGGIFSVRLDSLDGKIKSTTAKITEYDRKLALKEKELKAKYNSLEGTLKDLQNQSDKLKGFSNQGKGD